MSELKKKKQGRPRIHHTDEERIKAIKESKKKYEQRNKKLRRLRKRKKNKRPTFKYI